MIHEAKGLDMIQNPQPKDIAHIEQEDGTHKDYIYSDDNSWQEFDFGVNVNEYELYKTTVAQLPTFTMAQLEQSKADITKLREEAANTYYMMLDRDVNYYTLFVYDETNQVPEDKFENVVIECIQMLGEVKAISYQEDRQAIEFWVKDPEKEECSVGYVFPYDAGVVKYN